MGSQGVSKNGLRAVKEKTQRDVAPIVVYYDERQNVSDNDSFSPSAGKAKQAVESWKALGIPLIIDSFPPMTIEDISSIHDRKYVEDILNLKIPNGFGNMNPEVARSLPWVCGSMVASAIHSFTTGFPSFSPTSGAHHASWNQAQKFCTLNSLVLAAHEAHVRFAKRIVILDVDAHDGNDGIGEIIKRLELNYIQYYSFGSLNLTSGEKAEKWLTKFPQELFAFEGADLIIYNAGADSHIDDIGGVLTSEQMRLRDMYVYETAFALKIPICTALAGGYIRDAKGTIAPVLRLHDNTMNECFKAFQKGFWKKEQA